MDQRDFLHILRCAQRGETAELNIVAGGRHCRRLFRRKERLLILGGGHVARPLCALAAELDFAVTVADDRAEFAHREHFPGAEEILCMDFPAAIARFGLREEDYVVIVTRGHRWDDVCLRALLQGELWPRYVGMIGSRRRTSLMLEHYRREGYDPVRVDAVHTPIGLPIGAVTPREIAVSIAAELIFVRRSEKPAEDVLANTDLPLDALHLLAREDAALALVVESCGSTPAKSGSLMAVDAEGNIAGTIGGGMAEFEAASAARALVGTGESRLMTFSMDNDIAAGEGMACGGTITVYLADVR